MTSADMPAVQGHYPADLECDVLLSDGGTARLRPIRPDDGPGLRAFGERLSSETVYLRFFSPRRKISDQEIAHFVTVDYRDRLAIVAIIDGELVAVARYDRTPPPVASSEGPVRDEHSEPDGPAGNVDEAEVAFVVRDDHQGRGLGTIMLEHLASAAVARGIGRFVADTLPENHRMIGVFRSAGFDERANLDSGVVRVTMELSARPEYLERVEEREWSATVHSIEHILRPASIAVIGAGAKTDSSGTAIVGHLLTGGYTGAVYPVNATAAEVEGIQGYRKLAEVPGAVDLAIITVPAPFVSDVVRDCGSEGIRGLVIMTAGYSEQGPARAGAERDLVELARNFGMRLVGPNCVGVLNTSTDVRMNATVAERSPLPGRIALSSQSGGLGIALLEEFAGRGLGISSFVSLGNKADVSGNDLLRFWADDNETDVIVLYLESFGNPRKFSRIARRVARTKPIVAVKGARTTSGRRGADPDRAAGLADKAADALFRQAGVMRVGTLEELLDVADLLASQPLPKGRRVAVVGNAGGCGVLAADACESEGLEVNELAVDTRSHLVAVASKGAALDNPIGLVASATAEEYAAVLEIVLADSGVDAVLVTFTPPSAAGADDIAEAVAAVASASSKPVLANFLATDRTLAAFRDGKRRVPWFPYPESAARALASVARYSQWLERPAGTVPAFDDVDSARANQIVQGALEEVSVADADGPRSVWLDSIAASELLETYRIPVLPSLGASTPAEAAEHAGAMGYPVALKLDAPAIAHKSDVGGVRLHLGSSGEVLFTAEEMLTEFGPEVRLLVQPMAPPGVETVVGVVADPSFGPLVSFGLGGKEAELPSDRLWSLVPMTSEDAHDLITGLRSSPLLTGYRGSTEVDLAGLAEMLTRVARLAEDLPEVVEMSLNPVVAGPAAVVALEARVRVARASHEPLLRRAMRTA